jgi:hypothetical protein
MLRRRIFLSKPDSYHSRCDESERGGKDARGYKTAAELAAPAAHPRLAQHSTGEIGRQLRLGQSNQVPPWIIVRFHPGISP